jgi:hypothetical protein
MDSGDAEFRKKVNRLKWTFVAVTGCLIIGEGTMLYLGELGASEAYVLTPGAVVSFFFALYIAEAYGRAPLEGRSGVQSEFVKSSLMVMGAAMVTIGGTIGLYSLGGNPEHIMIDMGLGSIILCSGVMMVWIYR